MTILKCKMCGGELAVEAESTVCECEYCGSKQTIPNTDDEKRLKLYERANRLRFDCEFDKAAGVYESIVADYQEEAEAYWGLVLCKYGIEYVDDPVTKKKIPTCHRSSFDSVMDDPNFDLVMENADSISRRVYREEAKQIEEIRKGIIEVSSTEEPYDIFICYKETDENGNRTIDSVLAQNVYETLTNKGYSVFFSRITLEVKLGQEYEPYIFAALNSAKIMLAFGTSYDYYNAVWVKNEWSRFLKLMEKDKSKRLIPCYKDIDAYDIPKEFKHLQAQDMGKVGADQDLLRGIDKIIGKEGSNKSNDASKADLQDIQAAVENAVAAKTGNNLEAVLERAFITLEDGDYQKADGLFEDVLNQNPKCAEAYLGKLLVYYKVRSLKEFLSKVYDESIVRNKKVVLELADVKSIIRKEYFLEEQISDDLMDAIREDFSTEYNTCVVSLQQFDATKDYVKEYCKRDNRSGKTKTEFDDRYYERFKKYATDSVVAKYDIDGILKEMVKEATEKEIERINRIAQNYSKDKFTEILMDANLEVKKLLGDEEVNRIEEKYRTELQDCERREEEENQKYNKVCQELRENWPQIRKEKLDAWKAECNRLTEEYNVRKKEYDERKEYVERNNAMIMTAYNQAQLEYDYRMKELDNQIAGALMEMSQLGLFGGSKKEMLNQRISMLKMQKNSLVKPQIQYYGQLMNAPENIGPLQLPEEPTDSENPIYPPCPVIKAPSRGYDDSVDGKSILAAAFKKHEIKCKKLDEIIYITKKSSDVSIRLSRELLSRKLE